MPVVTIYTVTVLFILSGIRYDYYIKLKFRTLASKRTAANLLVE